MNEIDRLNLSYAREYMHRVRCECGLLESMNATVEETRKGLQSASGVRFDPMPKSPNAYGDAIPDGLIKVETLETECGLIDHALIDHAEKLVRSIRDTRARITCYYFYIRAYTWSGCERALGYSKPQLMRFRDNGLLEIAELEPQARAPRYPAI